MKNVHFISGLPRSGSTLLGSILRQNPEASASMSSPVFSLVTGMLPRLSSANEFNIFLDDHQRINILRGLFTSYYADHTGSLVFDTNRHWMGKMPLLLKLFPKARFICLVRSLVEVFQSFETQFALNSSQLPSLFNFDPDSNVYSRFDSLMNGNGLIGKPLNSLKEAFYGQNSDRLMLISYQSLATNPASVLSAIYKFIGQSAYAHDFNALHFETPNYDQQLGLPGLHDVRAKVSYQPKPIRFPPDLISRLAGPYFWEDSKQPTAANLKFSAMPRP